MRRQFLFLAASLFVLTSLLPVTGTAMSRAKPNVVVQYLGNAELQVETAEQRAEIRRALHDMLERSADELRVARYADYQGKAGAWTLPVLLQQYFVPDPLMSLDEDTFYRDCTKAPAKDVVRARLKALEN